MNFSGPNPKQTSLSYFDPFVFVMLCTAFTEESIQFSNYTCRRFFVRQKSQLHKARTVQYLKIHLKDYKKEKKRMNKDPSSLSCDSGLEHQMRLFRKMVLHKDVGIHINIRNCIKKQPTLEPPKSKTQ